MNLDVDDIMEPLEFVCNTTYFIFDGTIMQQKFGTAMGSPVSAAVANFYMEKLEHKALMTAPVNCKPRIWKRHVDDIVEAIKKDQTAGFTDHLNAVDETGSIKFTYKEVQWHNTFPGLTPQGCLHTGVLETNTYRPISTFQVTPPYQPQDRCAEDINGHNGQEEHTSIHGKTTNKRRATYQNSFAELWLSQFDL